MNANGQGTISASDLDNGSSDDCSSVSFLARRLPSGSFGISKNFDCNDVGLSVTGELLVTDVAGNTATCTAQVTVEDNLDPTALCKDITVKLNGSGLASISGSNVDNGSTDNCGVASTSVSPNTFNTGNIGNNTVTLTVTDPSGNSATCTANVTIEDDNPPTANCVGGLTVTLDQNGFASITGSDVDNGSTDNIAIVSYDVTPSTFDCADAQKPGVTVQLVVTDNSGNTDTCFTIVRVVDDLDPTALCQDVTVILSPSGTASIVGSDVNNGSTDNCGIASMTASPNTFDCNDVGSPVTTTLTVSDPSGNTATCTALVTVVDTAAPVASCVANLTVYLDVNGQATIATSDVDGGSTSGCGGVPILSLDQSKL